MLKILSELHEVITDVSILHDNPKDDTKYNITYNNDYATYTFSVKQTKDTTRTSTVISFVLSGITLGPEVYEHRTLCSFNVAFDTAWYVNNISNVANRISINNLPNSSAYTITTKNNLITLLPEQITEEWMFQLLTLHDIPYYEDMVEYVNIHETMNKMPFVMSINLNYKEQYWDIFLENIKGYLK
jgi:hypothetical protein